MPGRWETSTMPGKINIFGSVGRYGANLFGDVTIIQKLINLNIPIPLRHPIAVDGQCGPATEFAIEVVQRHALLRTQPTGKVEPDDPTFNFLTRGIAAEALGDPADRLGSQGECRIQGQAD